MDNNLIGFGGLVSGIQRVRHRVEVWSDGYFIIGEMTSTGLGCSCRLQMFRWFRRREDVRMFRFWMAATAPYVPDVNGQGSERRTSSRGFGNRRSRCSRPRCSSRTTAFCGARCTVQTFRRFGSGPETAPKFRTRGGSDVSEAGRDVRLQSCRLLVRPRTRCDRTKAFQWCTLMFGFRMADELFNHNTTSFQVLCFVISC